MAKPDTQRPDPAGDGESGDPVWALLEQAPRPEPPAFFVQKVMGRVESLAPRRRGWLWLLRAPAAPAWAAAALVLLFLGLRQPADHSTASPTPGPLASLSTNDLELLTDLDQLIAYEESAQWLDTPSF